MTYTQPTSSIDCSQSCAIHKAIVLSCPFFLSSGLSRYLAQYMLRPVMPPGMGSPAAAAGGGGGGGSAPAAVAPAPGLILRHF